MATVVLIADAGAGAGLGHIARSSALGAALLERGAQISAFGLQLGTPTERYGVQWLPADGFSELSASAIVLDSYKADREFRASLRAIAPLAVFGGDDDLRDDVDLRITEPACLGPPYWAVAAHEPPEAVRRVLVATGGGDVIDVGYGLATELRGRLPNASIALVRGPFSDQHAPPGVELVSAPPTLDREFAQADLVVCAGGQTLLEALAVGVPVVAMAVADNQRRQLAVLAGAGAVVAAEGPSEAVEAAARLACELEARQGLTRAARAAVDGRGALRAADAVLALCERRIRLRRATVADAELLLAWRNDPVTRRFSLTRHEIGENEHRTWLDARLSDPDTLLWIALVADRPVGQVRLTHGGDAAEIHIGLAATERGRGYGREIIRRAVERGTALWPAITTIFATIDSANDASTRVFEASGFRPSGTGKRFVLELRSRHNAAR